MDGDSGAGALILTIRFLSSTALAVELPNTAIRVSFCSYPGKFSNRESIPRGLKKISTSYVTFSRSENLR